MLRTAGLAEEAVAVSHEDPTGDCRLIAYVVPRAGTAATAKAWRSALQPLLPESMIPSGFVFLDRLPQTPGGKVDRRALPAPPHEPEAGRDQGPMPRDGIEKKLARIWESVLGVPAIGRREDFFDLGGTSLQSAQVLVRVEETFSLKLPLPTLLEHSTIEKLAALVAGQAVVVSPKPLVVLRSAPGGRPLFLVHSGQGDVAFYGQLVRRLSGRPIYGLQSIGLQGEGWPLRSIPAMAERYLRDVIQADPTGPYLLAGTCMGGMVAFEMAQQLGRLGRQVGLLALLDAPHPRPSWTHPRWTERLAGPVRDQVRDAFRILRWSLARAVGIGRSARWFPAYRRFVANMNSRANRSYRPAPYAGTLTLIVTADTPNEGENLRLMMARKADETRTITISGKRAGLFLPPTVDELAQALSTCLEPWPAGASE